MDAVVEGGRERVHSTTMTSSRKTLTFSEKWSGNQGPKSRTKENVFLCVRVLMVMVRRFWVINWEEGERRWEWKSRGLDRSYFSRKWFYGWDWSWGYCYSGTDSRFGCFIHGRQSFCEYFPNDSRFCSLRIIFKKIERYMIIQMIIFMIIIWLRYCQCRINVTGISWQINQHKNDKNPV